MAIDRQEDTPLPPLQQEDTPDPIDPVYGQTSLEPPTSSVSNDNGTYSSAHRTNMGNFGSKKTTEWSPAQYFDAQRREDDKPFALLILNQEITDLSMLENLWNNSVFRICADGGANRLYNALREGPDRESMLPDAIVGDLDSLLPHVCTFYESRGVRVITDPDQNSTDFGKCLNYISRHSALQPPDFTETHDALDSWRGVKVSATHSQLAVVALGGFGGRVDQSLHSIHALYVASATVKASSARRELLLISSESVTFLLEPGKNIIHTPRRFLGKTCGILPIGQPSIVTTRGLEWDLKGQETRFGGLVSTSNHLDADTVEVETSECVVFTVEIRRRALGGAEGGEDEFWAQLPVRSDTV